jgi:hypothetical protein
MDRLPQDDRFFILLHKKIMDKTGSAKRRAKKYYMDRYRKTGAIPKPLLLAGQGIFEGRKCSGRKRALCEQIKKRFVEMLKASSDPDDPSFIFITQKARTIKNYHHWLEQEFKKGISLDALRRLVKEQNLGIYLNKPDFEEDQLLLHAFKDQEVFDLVQMDGSVLQYLKIRNESSAWQKPRVLETYDTGSRNMFALDAFFSENSHNAVNIFRQFLLSTPFPQKTIRLRPDNAGAFLNLQRVIHALNIAYSVPDGFYLKANFSRARTPKDNAHLESSHRSLHNFEIRIIKAFDNRIAKIEPSYLFKNGKKLKIMVTYLDIGLDELRQSGMIEAYRRQHNESKHHFSVDGKTMAWIPAQKLEEYLAQSRTISFSPDHVKDLIKYGYEKIKATVSVKRAITFRNQKYIVAEGAEKFSRHQSTKVVVSLVDGKLLVFEDEKDGILLGEAIRQEPFEKPSGTILPQLKENEVELIGRFLEENGMAVDRVSLIERHRLGLTLCLAKTIFEQNKPRYDSYLRKLRQPPQITGAALFNAFMLDCAKYLHKASYGKR